MTVDLDALDDLTEFANYWIDNHRSPGEREAFRQTLHDIHAHFHVAPAEPVTLTAEEREAMSIALFDAYWGGSPRTRGFRWHESDEPELWHGLRDKFLEHITEHGFALVRTGGADDGK